MKTFNIFITTFMLAFSFLETNAQYDESIYTNGEEVYVKKDSAVKFNSFFARSVESKIYLSWKVSDLKYDGMFMIYRSSDGENYEIIGVEQSSAANGRPDAGYSFIDKDPVSAPVCYY